MITFFCTTVVYNFLNLDFLKRPINYFVTVLLRDMANEIFDIQIILGHAYMKFSVFGFHEFR